MSNGGEKVVKVLCIYYPVQFQKIQEQVRPFLDSGSEVNAINPAYVEKLGLKTCKTNVGAQKIDNSTFEIFRIVIADF